jgi:hypothetical protein
VFEAGAQIVRRWSTPSLERRLAQQARLTVHCLAAGRLAELEAITRAPRGEAYRNPIIEDGRVFARFPHFRDGSGIPDTCFEITDDVSMEARLDRVEIRDGHLELAGDAYLRLVQGTATVQLRRRLWGGRRSYPTERVATPRLRDRRVDYPEGGFRVAIDLRTVPDGRWSVALVGAHDGLRRRTPARRTGTAGEGSRDGLVAREGAVELRAGRRGELVLVVGRSAAGPQGNPQGEEWERPTTTSPCPPELTAAVSAAPTATTAITSEAVHPRARPRHSEPAASHANQARAMAPTPTSTTAPKALRESRNGIRPVASTSSSEPASANAAPMTVRRAVATARATGRRVGTG